MPLVQDAFQTLGTLQTHPIASITLSIVGILSAIILQRLWFDPLRHIPGPFFARVTTIPLYLVCYLGIEGRFLRHYHKTSQAKVLRIAPNHVSVADGAAVKEIYHTHGGYLKDARYQNFNLGPIVSIFSALDTDYRDRRAKAVAPLFAPNRLRAASAPDGIIGSSITRFIAQLEALKTSKTRRADILDLCARLSIDVVTGYLLDSPYGGFAELEGLAPEARQRAKLSANPFLHSIVRFSRFSLLPHRVFKLAFALSSRLNASDEVTNAFARLAKFGNHVVETVQSTDSGTDAIKAKEARDTYQGRLLDAGIDPGEVSAQSQAIVFAGADSTAFMLTTILFRIVQREDVQRRIREEVEARKDEGNYDPQSLPYLRAVIKEGLRLGMADPMRFTRVVPPGRGLHVAGTVVPPGAVVGCAPYILHFDEEIYPKPHAFRPERWLEGGGDEGLKRADMERNLIPFGAGLRACIGKNLAERQIYETISRLVGSGVLEEARTCKEEIEMYEWFNGEIKGHVLEVEWKGKGE